MKFFCDLSFENGSSSVWVFCCGIKFLIRYDNVFQEAVIRNGIVYVNSPMVNGVAELWYRA